MTGGAQAAAALSTDTPAKLDSGPNARELCDLHTMLAAASVPPGIVGRMAEAGRQLDANLVHLPARHVIDNHTESDLDVLVIVIAGTGSLTTAIRIAGALDRRLRTRKRRGAMGRAVDSGES